MGRKEWLLFSWTGRLSEGVPNFASQIDPLSPYQGGQIPQKEVTLLLCGFPKSLGHYLTLNSWIYALYESVSRKLWSPNGLSEAVASTIGVKQGCPISPTLISLYIDEVSQGCLMGIALKYYNLLMMCCWTPALQMDYKGQLNALKTFFPDKSLSIYIDITKLMV